MAPLMLGLMAPLRGEPERCVEAVAGLGFPTCQVAVPADEPLSDELAGRLRRAAEGRVAITTLWTHCRAGQIWNFVDGPETIGLVPAATRAAAVARLKAGADFARAAGVASIATHAGFIPENPGDPTFAAVVAALREVCQHCLAGGLEVWLETGQETPVTLLRTIEAVGTGNLGLNLDPANLLMYGKANPLDALDVVGPYVRGVHAKDGEYPTNGRELGRERPLGEGRVDFPRLIGRLKELGYAGALTIEREVRGPEQLAGIEQARQVLTPLL